MYSMCTHATVQGSSDVFGILRLARIESPPVLLTCKFPFPIRLAFSKKRRLILDWWTNCFIGWQGVAAHSTRTGPFAARLECSVLSRGECKGCIEWQRLIFANEMLSFLSCSGFLLSCGKEQMLKKWKAVALRQKLKVQGVAIREKSKQYMKKLKWGEPVCLDLLEFQNKWCGGDRKLGDNIDAMGRAKFVQECGMLVAHKMMRDLTGLKDPFRASVPKIVNELMGGVVGETLQSKREEIKVVGGLHLKPVCGFYSDPVVVLDIESMHPCIAVAEGICPTGKGVFAGILAKLLEKKRDYSRREGLQNRVLTRVVKRLMVSMTGWLGIKLEKGGTYARRMCYSNILAVSRKTMTDLVAFCEELFASVPYVGTRVVYGVTDSVFVCAPSIEATQLLDDLHGRLLRPRFGANINLKHERTFCTLLLVKCGMYCGYDTAGEFKQVGLKRVTQHPIETELVDLFYRVALAPSVLVRAAPVAALEQLLALRPQWTSTVDRLAKSVELLCAGGPTPPGLDALIDLPRPVPTVGSTRKRSLDVYRAQTRQVYDTCTLETCVGSKSKQQKWQPTTDSLQTTDHILQKES